MFNVPPGTENELINYSSDQRTLNSLDIKSIKFNMRIKDVKNLDTEYSEFFFLRGINFFIQVSRLGYGNLGIYLEYADGKDMPIDVSRTVDFSVTVLSIAY